MDGGLVHLVVGAVLMGAGAEDREIPENVLKIWIFGKRQKMHRNQWQEMLSTL